MEIKLVHVTKSFGAKQVIQPTSFVIQSGSLTTLLGPSGCGKTTLLRMIAGLETPDSGEIWFENRCVFSSEKKINIPPEKRGLGFVFQDFALWPHMTVFENVAFGLRAAGKTDKLDEKVKMHSTLYSWMILPSGILISCPAVSSSVWHLPARSSLNRPASCLTSRFPHWTHCCGKRCARNCGR